MAGEDPSLSVRPEEVVALGRSALDIARQCRDGLSALEADVRDVRDGWSGNNADVFGAGWDELHQGAVEVWDALMELAAKLGVTMQTFGDTDQSSGTRLLNIPGTGHRS